MNYIDPSGNILDPSDPTYRGAVIHKMIQMQYGATYSTGDYGIERYIPFGRASGLSIEATDSGILVVTRPEGPFGRADIIDFGEGGLYEIKPISARYVGVATVVIYISAWNSAVDREEVRPVYLGPGSRYPSADVIVGTDPADPSKWVKAKLIDPGVIVYWATNKKPGEPQPVYVFEWAPEKRKVEQRNTSAQPVPVAVPAFQVDGRYAGYLAWLAACTAAVRAASVYLGPGAFVSAGGGGGNPILIK